MKHITLSLACLFAVLLLTPARAFDQPPADAGALYCYGHAMVGFDSVINSRLGVTSDTALGLALHLHPTVNQEKYSTFMLKVVLDAYLWEGNPHDYAVTVFYQCAQHQTTMLSASGHYEDDD